MDKYSGNHPIMNEFAESLGTLGTALFSKEFGELSHTGKPSTARLLASVAATPSAPFAAASMLATSDMDMDDAPINDEPTIAPTTTTAAGDSPDMSSIVISTVAEEELKDHWGSLNLVFDNFQPRDPGLRYDDDDDDVAQGCEIVDIALRLLNQLSSSLAQVDRNKSWDVNKIRKFLTQLEQDCRTQGHAGMMHMVAVTRQIIAELDTAQQHIVLLEQRKRQQEEEPRAWQAAAKQFHELLQQVAPYTGQFHAADFTDEVLQQVYDVLQPIWHSAASADT